MKQFTEQEAIAIFDSGEWKKWTDEEIVKIQLFQDRLCLPFSNFHSAIEKVLGRPVFTHEFAFRDLLQAEYNKERPTPTFEDIIKLLPSKTKIIVMVQHADGKQEIDPEFAGCNNIPKDL